MVVEVKSRRERIPFGDQQTTLGDHGSDGGASSRNIVYSPFERVDDAKRDRIHRIAQLFRSRHAARMRGARITDIRFDIIAVWYLPGTLSRLRRYRIEHRTNAFY